MEYEQQTKSRFMTAQDVADEIGISKSRAYILIRDLNKELAKKGYYTIYYYNNNSTYSTVVELVNNDLLSSSKLKIGMTKQSVIDLLGQPIKNTADALEYDTFEYTQGYGYVLTFTIENNYVSKIKVYFEK